MIKQSTLLRRVLSALIDNGWSFTFLDDGETRTPVANISDVMKLFRNLDECHVFIEKVSTNERSWLRLIWQGPDNGYPHGEEIVSDHGVNLSSVIDPLYDQYDKEGYEPEDDSYVADLPL